jgi:N-acetylneuraminic acid mutarotase
MEYARDSSSAVVYNGNIYVFGGMDNKVDDTQDVFHSVVEWARINGDGGLSAWTHSWHGVENLNPPRMALAGAKVGEYVYAIGGESANAAPPLSSVVFSRFRSDGSLTEWKETSPLPHPFSRGKALSLGKHVYVLGGRDSADTINSVYFASVR